MQTTVVDGHHDHPGEIGRQHVWVEVDMVHCCDPHRPKEISATLLEGVLQCHQAHDVNPRGHEPQHVCE